MKDLITEFLTLFQTLKSKVNSNPNNVEWMAKNDEVLRSLCSELEGSFEGLRRRMLKKPQKFMPQSPKLFRPLSRDYMEKYRTPVAAVAHREREKLEEAWASTSPEKQEELIQPLREFWADKALISMLHGISILPPTTPSMR